MICSYMFYICSTYVYALGCVSHHPQVGHRLASDGHDQPRSDLLPQGGLVEQQRLARGGATQVKAGGGWGCIIATLWL